MSRKVDVAIIGAGTAGLSAYGKARDHTDSIVMIDRGPLGTLCARAGCMPSKLLIAAADHRHAVAQSSVFGIDVGEVRIDGKRVMERVRELRDDFVGSVLDYMETLPEAHRLSGSARFVDSGRLDVNGEAVEARTVIIATGSKTVVPEVLKGAGDRLITNERIFELETLPGSVAIVGGGVIGLELGQALHRLGVRVRLFERGDSLGPNTDPEIRSAVTRIFKAELPCMLSAEVRDVTCDDKGGVSVSYRDGSGAEKIETFEYVLAATGRRPVLDDLDLEAAGVELDQRGVPHFDPTTLQCSQDHIFVAGDANRRQPFLHEAADDGRIAGENAARYPEIRAHPRRQAFSISFTDPQIAMVGASFDELDHAEVGVGEVSFENQGRSRVIAENTGCARLYGERRTARFVGAELVGPAVEHLAHLLAWSIESGLTVHDMLRQPFYHPVIEEGLRTALKDLRRNLAMGPRMDPDCIDCGPGV